MVALVAATTVLGACGDTGAPREFIEPVPFDPTTTLAGIVATDRPTTTLGFIATSAETAAAMFGELVLGHDLADVPDGAWFDSAYAGCNEGIWDRRVNFALAEDFSLLDLPAIETVADDQVLMAELLWLKAVELCAADFPPGAIGRGPPAIYEFPRCRQQFELWALPWSDKAGEPDIAYFSDLGLVDYFWSTEDGLLAITQGVDANFDADYLSGTALGEIEGNAATALGDGGYVEVLWRLNAGHCGAFRMLLDPAPETDNLAGFVQGLLEPPNFFANAAEIRMSEAVGLVEGYTDIGGEPSHGGPAAVYTFEDAEGWFDVHAIPVEEADPEPPQVADVIEVEGTTFELFNPPRGGSERGVQFEADGYRITVHAVPNDERLMTFALEFRRAWLAAAPSDTEG